MRNKTKKYFYDLGSKKGLKETGKEAFPLTPSMGV